MRKEYWQELKETLAREDRMALECFGIWLVGCFFSTFRYVEKNMLVGLWLIWIVFVCCFFVCYIFFDGPSGLKWRVQFVGQVLIGFWNLPIVFVAEHFLDLMGFLCFSVGCWGVGYGMGC